MGISVSQTSHTEDRTFAQAKRTTAGPEVGILVSSYNHRQYLADCLDSILNQTYENFSLVVVDDGSQDGSHELIEAYTAQYPEKVRYLFHPGRVNRGISPSCNLGLSQIQSPYVAWVGSDDLWERDKLEKQVALLEQDPRLGFVYSQATVINAEGVGDPDPLGRDISKSSNPVSDLLYGNWVPASSILIRGEALQQTGGFDESLIYSDWDLFIRLASGWKVGFINEPLIRYRIHGKNVSAGINLEKNLHRNIEVLQALSARSVQDRGLLGLARTRALIHCQISHHHFLLGSLDAQQDLQNAFACDPGLPDDQKWVSAWLERLWLTHRFTPQTGELTRSYCLWVLLLLQALKERTYLEGFLPMANRRPGFNLGSRELKALVIKTLGSNPRFWIRNPHLFGFFTARFLGERITNRIEFTFLKNRK